MAFEAVFFNWPSDFVVSKVMSLAGSNPIAEAMVSAAVLIEISSSSPTLRMIAVFLAVAVRR